MIMKKVFNSLFVIIAAMVTFAGCAKQEVDAPATPETKSVQFFANSIETKTAFGTPDGTTYPTLWEKDDKVKVFVNLNTVTGVKTEEVVSVNPSDDFKEATFKSTERGDSGSQDYTFYAVCPSDAYQSNSRNSETGTFTVMIPQTQKPTDDSVDSKAQVIYAVSENYRQPQMPTNVDLDFQHFSAYCKLSFSGLSVELGNIAQVTLESEVDLAGKWHVNVGEGEPTVADGSKKIIITTDKSENIWIACAPADVRGKKIKFIIDAMDGSSVSREVTFPNEDKYQFKSSRIANLTIDMTKGELVKPTVDKCFEKVTSDPSDWTGTYLIVYEGDKVAFDGSLATLDAAGNTISVTITDNKIVYTETLMKSTFAISKNGDSYSIKSASGKYIGNKSNSNALTSNSTALENELSFKSKDEIDVISSGGAYLRYNATSGQNRFRYFKSGTYTGQKAIQLYKLVGDESEGGDGGETPEPEPTPYIEVSQEVFTVPATQTSVTFTVEANVGWGIEETGGVEASIIDESEDGLTMTIQANFDANESSEPKTYTITFVPVGLDETVTVTINQEAKVEVDYSFEPGQYWIVANGKYAMPLESNYGYIQVDKAGYTDNVFTIVRVENGYTIQQADGKYLYMNGTYDSFNVSATAPTDNSHIWTIAQNEDGSYKVVNTVKQKYIQLDSQYGTYGAYNTEKGTMPNLVSAADATARPVFSVTSASKNIAFDVTEASFEIVSNQNWTVVPGTGVSVDVTSGTGNATITMTFAENTSEEDVVYTAKVKADGLEDIVLTVTQACVPNGNVEITEQQLTWTIGTKAYSEKATIDGTSKDVLKLGTSSAVGSATIKLPAGTVKVKYSAVGWNGKTSKLQFKNGSTEIHATTLKSNTGAANNSPYTISTNDSDHYEFEYTVTTDTNLTITTVSGATRAIIWDIIAVVEK